MAGIAIPRQMRGDPFRYPVAPLAAIVGQGSIIPYFAIPPDPLDNLAKATEQDVGVAGRIAGIAGFR